MSEYYAGLDVADLTTAVCVIDSKGAIIFESSVATEPNAIQLALKPYRRMIRAIAQESGPKASWLHKEFCRKKLPAICLDARIASAHLGTQRNKTDKNDARGLANIVRQGWYTTAHVKSDEALKTRLLLTYRRALKRNAIRLEMTLRISVKAFGATVQKTGGNLLVKWKARYSDPAMERLAQSLLRARSSLLKEVKALDVLIQKSAKADPVSKRLMTMPGIGPLTALTFRAGVDDPQRFKSSRTVGAHFGLTPRRKQSGQTDVSGRISRMGDETVRSALFEAAMVLICVSRSKCALRAWALRQREAKGVRHAAVALARKMAVILHRMWVSERDFDPALQPR